MASGEKAQGTVLAKSAATPSENAITNLENAVREAHNMIEDLIVYAKPHLPRHLFDNVPDTGCVGEAMQSRVPDYSDSNSEVINGINRSTNEVDRLASRISFLRTFLVV